LSGFESRIGEIARAKLKNFKSGRVDTPTHLGQFANHSFFAPIIGAVGDVEL
jgi:hypothetical protein